MMLLQIEWNPSKGIDLGFITLHYYSLMWIVAFLIGLQIMKPIFKKEGEKKEALDALFIYSVIGLLLGARLGDVFFYSWDYFKDHLIEILLPIREDPNGSIFGIKGYKFYGFRGLASHGAAVGMIIAMYFYRKKHLAHRSWLWVLDRVVIPVALGGIFVRIGNFINSEIIGKYTNSDYGVIFKQLGETKPRHPAQLYEAFCYIFVFLILLYFYWKTNKSKKEGFLFGLFLVLLWSIRFMVEFVKESQGGIESSFGNILSTGQLLSIPFILLGFYFMFFYKPKQA